MKRPKHPREKLVMIISDYPITSEIDSDIPYSSASNLTLLSDLHKVGIKQSDCYCTYLNYERPEKEDYDWHKQFIKIKNQFDIQEGFVKLDFEKNLYVSEYLYSELQGLLKEIETVKPKLIIITGKWSLYFLTFCVNYTKTQGTGKSQKPLGGIASYRASILKLYDGYSLPECIIMPILPAVTKQREPSKIPVMQWDYRKLGDIFKSIVVENENLDVWLKPKRESIIGVDLDLIKEKLIKLLKDLEKSLLVSIDIETRHGTIDCIGFSWNKTEGIVIPFSTIDNPNPWSFEEELELTLLMLKVLKNKNLQIVGQNFSYDSQYLNKFYMVNLHPYLDTMIANHVLYNYMQKDLSFLASIYVNTFSQWKHMQTHEVK